MQTKVNYRFGGLVLRQARAIANPFKEMKDRNLLYQVSNQKLLDENFGGVFETKEKLPGVYIGFDPTAESIHIGNYLGLVALNHFRRANFKPIVVFGGATGLIGDPSGRSTERTLLSETEVNNNISRF